MSDDLTERDLTTLATAFDEFDDESGNPGFSIGSVLDDNGNFDADAAYVKFGITPPHGNHVDCEADVAALFTDQRQPTTICGYCGDSARTRTVKKAISWFHAHACAALADNYEANELLAAA